MEFKDCRQGSLVVLASSRRARFRSKAMICRYRWIPTNNMLIIKQHTRSVFLSVDFFIYDSFAGQFITKFVARASGKFSLDK
jgi:hypothetical protein